MQELFTMVTNQGFAIAVAVYTIVVVNKTVQRNTEIMTKIATKLGIDTTEDKK